MTKLFKIRFSYTDTGEGLFYAQDEDHLILGFNEMFSAGIENLQILDIEEIDSEVANQIAPTEGLH